MADFERAPVGTKDFVQDVARIFRGYERQHRMKATGGRHEPETKDRIAKAERNARYAERAEALLRDF